MMSSIRKQLKSAAVLIAMGSLFVACSQLPRRTQSETPVVQDKVERAAASLDAAYVLEVNFKKNESALSQDDQASLRRLVQEAEKNGKIDEVKVVAWSDGPYPSKQKGELNHKQRDLADKRAEHIEDFLDELNVGDVDLYNMAKRPNSLERLLNTSDARVKRSLESAGLTPGPATLAKNSRAVVMVFLKD